MAESIRFENYELLRRPDGSPFELGRGAMGVTYKARDTDLHCDVALKVISPEIIGHSDVRERFLREARAAARLRHPNIATVFRLGVTAEGTHYYAMEFCDGITLHEALKTWGPLTAATAVHLAWQVSKALRLAEEHRLIHRDLKPANLIVTEPPDEGLVIKVIDFGLAKSFAEGHQTLFLSGAGFAGTAHFASPEQIDERELDIRSDIYSLGACLWFMLTGHPPFEGPIARVMSQTLTAEPPWAQLIGQPACVIALLRRMLAKRREDRQATVTALRMEMERCMQSMEAQANEEEPATAAAGPIASSDAEGLAARFHLGEPLGRDPLSRLFRATYRENGGAIGSAGTGAPSARPNVSIASPRAARKSSFSTKPKAGAAFGLLLIAALIAGYWFGIHQPHEHAREVREADARAREAKLAETQGFAAAQQKRIQGEVEQAKAKAEQQKLALDAATKRTIAENEAAKVEAPLAKVETRKLTTPPPSSTPAQLAYEPAPGSDEREAIMDVMRLDFYSNDMQAAHQNPRKVLFQVSFLKVHGDWAMTSVNPIDSNGKTIAEPRFALLRRISGKWTDAKYFDTLRPFASEESAQNTLDLTPATINKIRRAFLSAPADVFPEMSKRSWDRPHIYLQIASESQRKAASDLAQRLVKSGCTVVGIENVSGKGMEDEIPSDSSEFRYFASTDSAEAQRITKEVASFFGDTGIYADLPAAQPYVSHARQYEIWFSRAFSPPALISPVKKAIRTGKPTATPQPTVSKSALKPPSETSLQERTRALDKL